MSGPYLTQAELLAAPTGVNWGTIPGKNATVQEQQAELANILLRASAWIESTCFQPLYATTDTDTFQMPGRNAVLRRDGGIAVFTTYSPVVSASQIQYSADAQNWSTLGWTPLAIGKQRIVFLTGTNVSGSFNGYIGQGWLKVTYIDGYPNALLTNSPTAGAVSCTVDDPTGIVAGNQLTIYDGVTEDILTVAPSYVVGSTTLPFVTGMTHAHTTGARISGLPGTVREAAIMAAVHYARVRGRDTLSLASTGGTRQVRAVTQTEELDEAARMLVEGGFRRVL